MKKMFSAVVLFFLVGSLSFAQIDYEKRLDLTFNTTLANTFGILEKELDINIVVDAPIRNQRIDIRANNMTAENIFNLIFQMNDLDYKKIDEKTFFIFSASKTEAYNADITRFFALKYTDAQLLASLIRSSLKINNVFVNPMENTLTIRASRSKIQQVEDLLKQMENSDNYFEKTYKLSYIGAQKAIEIIGSFSRISASIIDEEKNRISIRGRKKDFDKIENLVSEIDKQVPQVVIEVTLLDVSEGFKEEIGFEFDNSFELNSDTSASILYKIINPNLLKLSKNSQNTEILSNPSLMVIDREEASINIGERVPIITARNTGESSGGGYDVIPQVEYVDAGIILNVTPEIHQDDEITIKVDLEVSSIGDYVQSDYGVYPIFTNKNIDTMVRLKSGEGVVFGGLISSEEREIVSSVPFFGDLPGIGRLFSKRNKEPRKSEIMMFITPHLINPEKGETENVIE